MPFPWSWNPTSPNASTDKVSDFPSMAFHHGDKTTLKDLLPLTDLASGATLGWRVRQLGNVIWITWNAHYTGGTWTPDDSTIRPMALRYNANGTLDVMVGTASIPITWSAVATWNDPAQPAAVPAAYSVTPTWNSAGTTFIGALVNVTDTASASDSRLLDLQVGGATRLRVLKDGVVSLVNKLTSALGTITSDTPFFDLSATWNSAGTMFAAIKMAITDTASAANSKLIELLVGGSMKFAVFKDGRVRAGADPTNALDLATKQYVDAAAGGASSRVLDAQTSTIDVVNTTTETDIYNFTVPGGTLGTNKALRFTLIGDLLKNDGGAQRTWTLRFYYGASVHMSWSRNPNANSATRQMLVLTIDLHAAGATNSQVAWGRVMSSAGANPVNGVVDTNVDPGYLGAVAEAAPMSVNSAADREFRITAQWGFANPNLSLRRLSARLELIQ